MGTLGFRPEAVRSLRSALLDCLRDMGGVRVLDPEAAAAAQRLSRVTRTLADWPTRLDRVANSSVLTEFDAASGLSPAVPVTWSSPYIPGGWYTIDDKMLDPAFTRGWNLAKQLDETSDDELSYEVDLDGLFDSLGTVIDDPTARRALMEYFGQDDLDQVFARIHAARDANAPSQFAENGPDRFARLADILVVLGRGIADQYREDGSIDPAASMKNLSSTEAAWLLSGMELDPEQFAALAYDLIDAPGPKWTWPPGTNDQLRPGDILLPLIADRPDTSRSFVDLCVDGSFDVLFDRSNDTTSPGSIVLHAADPTVLRPEEAGRTVTNLLEYLLAGGINKISGWPDVDLTFLGEIVVRYPLEILANGAWSSWSDKTAIAALMMIVSVDGARQWIQSSGEAIFHNLAAILATPIEFEHGDGAALIDARLSAIRRVLSQLGAFETMFLTMSKEQAIMDAEATRAAWELFGGIVVDIAGALLLGPAAAGLGVVGETAVGLGVGHATGSAVSPILDQLAKIGIGVDPAVVAASESEKLEVTVQAQAGLMVRAVYQFLIEQRLLDPAAEPPPVFPKNLQAGDCSLKQYGITLAEWADGLGDRLTGRTRGLIDTAIAMTGEAPASLLCAA